ncbi:hypothetical protein QP157_15350 [Sphingomonas sp. LR61]|uniref:hypothetical protein n=1 Tax=Sphingomonas sp. LR61 TaxID=3050234 RepID=UPI002FE1B839
MTTTEDELAALRAENERLRIRLAGQDSDDMTVHRRGWGWAIPSAALIVVGALLAPVVVITTWAQREVTSTEAFVATFAPLARDRAVQTLVADRTVGAIEDQLDVAGLTGALFDGIRGLDLPPRAKTALSALEAPATAGIQDLVSGTVDRFVASDQFADLWEQLLRTGHTQMVASLSGDRRAAVAIGADGSIGIQLGPVVAEVKERLVDRGSPSPNGSSRSTGPSSSRRPTRRSGRRPGTPCCRCPPCGCRGSWSPASPSASSWPDVGPGRSPSPRSASPSPCSPRSPGSGSDGCSRCGRWRRTSCHATQLEAVYDTVVAFAAHAAVAGAVLAACVALVAWFAGSSGHSPTSAEARRPRCRGTPPPRRRPRHRHRAGRGAAVPGQGRHPRPHRARCGHRHRARPPARTGARRVDTGRRARPRRRARGPPASGGARGDAGVSPGTDDPVGSAAH